MKRASTESPGSARSRAPEGGSRGGRGANPTRCRWIAAVLMGIAAATAVGCRPPATDHAALETDMDTLLARSAAAWNAGDLDAFVSDYAPDSTTTFVSAGRPQYGFDWIRNNYAPAFAEGAARDSLRFENIAARPLGATHALVTARFVLFRGDSITASGPFTLVLTRSDGRWLIIHDHTSSDPR